MYTPPLLRLPLRDGTVVGLRPLVRADAGRLLRAFDALSFESRRFRFLSPLSHLSEEQARYLADVDGWDHTAWGALDLEHLDLPGLGVGRMVRLEEEPSVAEFSLAVADEAQGRGLGAVLLALLVALAQPRGIETLRGYVAADNTRMARWMRRLGARAEFESGIVTYDVPTSLSALPDGFRREVERVQTTAQEHGIRLTAP